MSVFSAMWNEPTEIKSRLKAEPKDMMEVRAEMRAMTEVLKGFMPLASFRPLPKHHL